MFPPTFLVKALLLFSLSLLLLCLQLALFLANLDGLRRLIIRKCANQEEKVQLEPVERESRRIVGEDGKNDEFSGDWTDAEADWHDLGEEMDLIRPWPDLRRSHPLENSCKFPQLLPDEPDLLANVRHFRQVNCPPPPQGHLPLVSQLPNGQILFGIPHRANLSDPNTIGCFARPIGGTFRPRVRRFQWLGNWTRIPQNRIVEPKWEQFVVKCFQQEGKDGTKRLVFHDAFTNILPKARPRIPAKDGQQFGIFLFIIDSTARTQFFRHMPLCAQMLKEAGFFVMNGYNKIGDNSAINLLAVLSGMVYQPVERGFEPGWFGNDSILDEPTIRDMHKDFWQHMDTSIFRLAKMADWTSLWNDEIATSGFGLFHYNAFRGFLQAPGEHYFRPFYEYIYQRLGASSGCINGKMAAQRFIDIWERFATKHKGQPQLALNFLTGLTHASANNLELLDEPLALALGRLKAGGHFEENFVILMGDHGQRISSIQRSHSGRVEERMPFLAIHMPEKFARKWPEKVERLAENQNRLISNFDLYQTLLHILELSTQNLPNWDLEMALESARHNRPGHSLFGPISSGRNCREARVPHQFCCCMEQAKLGQDKLPVDFLQNVHSLLLSHLSTSSNSSSSSPSTCLPSNLRLELAPQNVRIFQLNAQARAGIRSPTHLQRLLQAEGPDGWKVEEDVLEVELEGTVTLTRSNRTRVEVRILTRFGVHLGEGQGPRPSKLLLRGEPLVLGWSPPVPGACEDGRRGKGQEDKSRVFTLAQLCRCLEGTRF